MKRVVAKSGKEKKRRPTEHPQKNNPVRSYTLFLPPPSENLKVLSATSESRSARTAQSRKTPC